MKRHSFHPGYFAGLKPLARAIEQLTPANVKETKHDDREAQIAAQRRRIAKYERRLKRERKD